MSFSGNIHLTRGAAAQAHSVEIQQVAPTQHEEVSKLAQSKLAEAASQAPSAARQLQGAHGTTKTHNRQSFFSMFEGNIYSIFKPEDIEHLHHLMEKNLLGGYVSFVDLIGLDCLETIEEARLFFSSEAFKDNEKTWVFIYLQWVVGSLRVQLNNENIRSPSEYSRKVFVFGRTFLDILKGFSHKFFEDLNREYQTKIALTRTKSISERLKAESHKIPLIKFRWQKNMNLIEAITSSSDGGVLFFKQPLQHFYQQEQKFASSVDEAKQSLAQILKLSVLFEKGLISTKLQPEHLRFFQDIIKSLDNVIGASPKGLKQACEQLKKDLKDKEVLLEYGGQVMTEHVMDLGKLIDTSDQPNEVEEGHINYELQIYQLVLNYYSELMINKIAAQLDVVMLPAVNQNHIPRIAWIHRAFTAITTILKIDIPIDIIKEAKDLCAEKAEWQKQLSVLKLECFKKIIDHQPLLKCLGDSCYQYGYLPLFYNSGVACFAVELECMLRESIDKFEKALESCEPDVEYLVEKTKWLTKLLFLEHDLNVLIGKQEPKDEEEILAPYLGVLDRVYYQAAEKKAAEKRQQQIKMEADLELQELIAHIGHMDITIGQVQSKLLPQQPLNEHFVQPSNAVRVTPAEANLSPEKEKILSKKTPPLGRFTEDQAEAFKHLRNASFRIVEKQLREIGLKFLRQKGSHRQYGLEDDKSVRTTVAVHAGATVPPSILREIVKQVGVVKPS